MSKFLILLILLCCGCEKDSVFPPAPVYPLPTPNQRAWQSRELLAFVHFTVNTFTDKEWGYGDENPDLFYPADFNAEQWVKVLKDAGFKGAILTCKHHDGFCLWPSKFGEHSVKNVSWKNGKGDVVREFRDACTKYGLDFGVYLSPWDRNRADYGSSSYVEYYQNQLKELLDQFGPVFEVWFDGANGGEGYYGGARETRKIDDQVYYHWSETYKIVKNFNSRTIIQGDVRAWPDARWCGNEKGFACKTNWNPISPDTVKIKGKDFKDRVKLLHHGSEQGTRWIPAEVDVSIRPGWFYHAAEDSLVKSPEELFEIYLSSVGRGSNLLLSVAPDKRGLIPEQDVQSLLGWRKMIDHAFRKNLAAAAELTASSYRGKSKRFDVSKLNDDNANTYWATDDDVKTGTIEISFDQPAEVNYLVLQEYIPLGQRVKSFTIDVFSNNKWRRAARATTIGYKRIVRIDPRLTERIRINIDDSRACPAISAIEVY